jgi:hypothetical protein
MMSFFDYESPGLVFFATYPRGSIAPSAFQSSGKSALRTWLRFPP